MTPNVRRRRVLEAVERARERGYVVVGEDHDPAREAWGRVCREHGWPLVVVRRYGVSASVELILDADDLVLSPAGARALWGALAGVRGCEVGCRRVSTWLDPAPAAEAMAATLWAIARRPGAIEPRPTPDDAAWDERFADVLTDTALLVSDPTGCDCPSHPAAMRLVRAGDAAFAHWAERAYPPFSRLDELVLALILEAFETVGVGGTGALHLTLNRLAQRRPADAALFRAAQDEIDQAAQQGRLLGHSDLEHIEYLVLGTFRAWAQQ
jgi:hypothetical protein